MARKKTSKPRYPQRCKICGHCWLSWSWKGPIQCPWPGCGNARWRLGPRYLTENRKAQGWKTTKGVRKGLSGEFALLGTPLYDSPILVEPLGLVVEEGEVAGAPALPKGSAGRVGGEEVAQDAPEGPSPPLRATQPSEDEEFSEEGS